MKLSLVPTERRFYELFRKQGELLSETLSDLSKSMLEGRSRHPRLRDLEHQADNVTHEIYRLTNRTFVTPIDQEDILLLAHSLDEVVDLAEEVADKIDLYNIGHITDQAKEIGECLERAGKLLQEALERLEDFNGVEPLLKEIHRLENEGDRLSRDAIASLFARGVDPMVVIRWKDIVESLEQAIDSCETVAHVLEGAELERR